MKKKRARTTLVDLCGKDAAVVFRCNGKLDLVLPQFKPDGSRIREEERPELGEPFHLGCAVHWMLGQTELRERLLKEYERALAEHVVRTGGATVQ